MLNEFFKPGFGTEINTNFTNLGSFINQLLPIIFYLSAFLAFFWLIWGAFQYIVAGGDKENLAKARSRITWAIIGLILVLLAFLVAQFAEQIVTPKPGKGSPFSLTKTVSAAVKIEDEFAFGDVKSLSQGVDRLVRPTFSIATTLVVFYFLVGAFRFLTSGGNKESVSGARNMITHAIIGFVILMFTFLILQFVLSNLFNNVNLKIVQGL